MGKIEQHLATPKPEEEPHKIPLSEVGEQEREPEFVSFHSPGQIAVKDELLTILPEGSELQFGVAEEPEKAPLSYTVFEPKPVDERLLSAQLEGFGLSPEDEVLILPNGPGRVGFETRRLYFFAVVDNEGKLSESEEKILPHQVQPTTRIISFGRCNVACPYCKRDCQFIDEEGNPLVAIPVKIKDIAGLVEGAVSRNEVVRFSGGDPVMYPRVTLALARYLWERHRVKVSIAHNGSGPRWVERMLPYLSSAAIDLKAVPEKIGKVMGISSRLGEKFYYASLRTQSLISNHQILLDVRTPIFGDTTIEEMMRLAIDISEHNDPRYTFWTWRLYKPVKGCDWPVPQKENVLGMMEQVSGQFPHLWLGIRAKWEKGGMLFFKEGKLVSFSSDVSEEDIEALNKEGLKLPSLG